MNKIFKEDYYAFYGENWSLIGGIKRILSNRDLRYVFVYTVNSQYRVI